MLTGQFTSEILISLLAAAITIIIGLVSVRWWKTPGVIYFSLMMLAIGGWALSTSFEADATQAAVKFLWARMQFIGIAFLLAFWLLLILQYTYQDKRLSPWWITILSSMPVITILLAVTGDTSLWVPNIILPESTISIGALVSAGAWWLLIFAIYSYLLIIIGAIILIRRTVFPPRSGGVRALVLLSGLLPPLISNMVYQSLPIKIITLQEMLMVGLMISGLIYFWGVYYFQLLEYSSLSHDMIIDKMSEGVIVLDRRDRIYNINSTAMSMLGLKPRSAKRKGLNDIIAIWPGIAETFRVPHDFDTEVRINGDAPRTLSVQTTNLKDKDGQSTGRMVVWRDITQYRQVESTLRDSEARFKALFQGAPDAIIITDKNGRIILVNNQTITLFGYSIDELVGRKLR